MWFYMILMQFYSSGAAKCSSMSLWLFIHRQNRGHRVIRNNSSVSELTLVSSALLKSEPADNCFSSPSHFVSTSRMTSGENIDLNWNACSSLSKSAGSPSVQENNAPFCCSLGKGHYSGCLGPRARHSHSAGPGTGRNLHQDF